MIFPIGNHWLAFLIWSTFAFSKCHNSRLYGGGKTTLRLNLADNIWWWQFWCKEYWTPGSTTKFGWEAKIKSMQEGLSLVIWFGSWITCSSPNWDVIPSILVLSEVVLPKGYHTFVCALRSPRTAIKYGCLSAIESRLSSSLSSKDSN